MNSTKFRVECEDGAIVLCNTIFARDEQLLIGVNADDGLRLAELNPNFTNVRQAIQHIAATFADWVNGGPEPETSGRKALHTPTVMDAIIESGNSGRPARVRV